MTLPISTILQMQKRQLFATTSKLIVCILLLLSQFNTKAQTNAIVTENLVTGSPSTEWDISGSGDPSIQGFATSISINAGETVHFKIDVKAPATDFSIKIFRIGYYQGNGARLKAALGPFNGVAQPDPIYDIATGKTDCSNWSELASWNSIGAVSGVYIAKLTRADNNASSHIVFIVRNDASNADILFKTSDATWQAYNGYGGNSFYVNNSGTAVPGFNHATKISYNRPFKTRDGGAGGGAAEDWLFNAEYPMIRWLERNGYDISYSTDVDMDKMVSPITPSIHKVLLSVGHDEYWSAAERANFETARNNGVHLAFFSGNEVYWKTRWEDNNRTLVCYKEGTEGENTCGGKCDPISTVWTGLWRDGCAFPSADGCNAENKLTGQISWDATTGAIQVPDTYKNLRFWRNTSVASLTTGQTATLSANSLGYEWDPASNNGKYPLGRILLSNTSLGGKTHQLSLYRHSSGALVFGAGTVQWSWGLDGEHDRGSSTEDSRMQQATINLLADMNTLPASIQGGYIANSPTDNTIPTSTITAPLNGISIVAGTNVTITGTATDNTGVIAGVEISVDGGISWNLATGTTTWTYDWTPGNAGLVNILSRAYDDNGNMEAIAQAPAANSIEVTITGSSTNTIFQSSNIPANVNGNDNQPIEVGMKFRSSAAGSITGIRFYKATGDNGTHIGHLWSSNGNLLASVTFTGESATGWQQMNFVSPISINANTTYVISYHSSANFYSFTDNYFTSPVVNGVLTALADGTDGPNGLYIYSATPAFPTSTSNKSNYWVDIVYSASVLPDNTAPTVLSTIPASNANNIITNAVVNVVFSEPIDPLTVNSNSIDLHDAANTLIPATVSYSPSTNAATLTPNANLAYATLYTVSVKGGLTDPRIKDIAGNSLAANYNWTFTTKAAPAPPPAEGPGGPILVLSTATNPFSRYTVEILRAEGLNEFYAMDITGTNASILNSYDVIILGEMSLSVAQVNMLTDWVNAGGSLISFKPGAELLNLMGLTSTGSSISDKYLLVNTATSPGTGIVGQTIQFHGVADQYNLNGATSIATLFSAAGTATSYPAITQKTVGSNGGSATAFCYDLAKSIVYTRQGNPLWAGQERDGKTDNIRSDDMFFPDWIDLNKVAIPQADEQQHLLNNIILHSIAHRKILPKFWFLPRKLKATIVMTGDDHGNGGTIARFNQYLSYGNNSTQDVLDWKAVRGTSYIYTNTPISDAQAASFNAQGFEIGLHLNTNCSTYTQTSLEGFFNTQLPAFMAKYVSLPSPTTHRTHCISWSDWASKPKVEVQQGIRLNTDYYYWPDTWVLNRPGMFTGSGQPMRFADLDGTILDNYQVTTQMPDESGISFPGFINSLLDSAIGTPGYYGVFCANMHTDANTSAGSDAIIASAQARQIPVISAKQMLTWLDARNASSFGNITWTGNNLSFTTIIAADANKIQGMVPVNSNAGQLNSLTLNGVPVTYSTEIIKGINYAFFDASSGNYIATYLTDVTAPIISNIVATPHTGGTATITWTTDEASNTRVDYGNNASSLSLNSAAANYLTSHSITLTGLSSGTTYYYRVSSADINANSSTIPLSPNAPLSFTTPSENCASDITAADFSAGTTDANTVVILENDGAVSLKPMLNEEFTLASIPSGWTNGIWNAGGATSFNNGQAIVDGSHISNNISFGPGSSLEFTATYTAGDFQNIGFTADAAFNNPWITIGRAGAGDNNLYARNNSGQSVVLGTTLLNTPHKYKIKWLTNGAFEFYVDDVLVPTAGFTQTVLTNMIVQISDYVTGGVSLSVDWIRATPYATTGTYTSRIFDAGSAITWGTVNWTADLPANTDLLISIRTGNTPVPDGSWTAYTAANNGNSVGCGTARYLQYKAVFSCTNNNVSAKLNDLTISCNGVADITAPLLSNLVATPNSNGTALITWTTNEASTSLINYGTISNNLNQSSSNTSLVLNHSITLSGLIAGNTYYYQVSSADCSSNAGNLAVANFTVPYPNNICLQDQLTTDFAAGTVTNTYINTNPDGEVTLKPTATSEFTTTPPTTEWNSFPWGSGGSSTVSNGAINVDGARYNSDIATSFSPGAILEFKATFNAAAFQHIGFGGGTDANGTGGIYNGENAWAMFSTGNTSTVLKVRTFNGSGSSADFDLPGSYLGSAHIYKIVWNSASVDYYIDGILVRTEAIAISQTMRPAISDASVGGPTVNVDWIHASPYSSSGIFISRIYDAGSIKTWGTASWTADIPNGTTLQLSQRQSNSAVTILAQPWSTISANAANIGGNAQFIQYKADFSTPNTALTPVLKDFSVTCSTPSNSLPIVTISPIPQTICSGNAVSFVSDASGYPTPSIQWQVSINNGNTWSNISGATNATYTFTVSVTDAGKIYRANWSNPVGAVNSTGATLLVNPLPTATISAVNNPICTGASISLQLASASGASPYSLIVNGNAYTNITVGQIFATYNPAEISIWGNSGSPSNPSATDNQSIEIGTKFRSTQSGYINGIRFYKGITNTGTHTAHLWSSNGTLLATATFGSESVSGWQEVRFITPVAIQANTTYIASYFSAGGYFAISAGYFTNSGTTNGPLTALQNGADGVNGVYIYGGGFPTNGGSANYWVDVLYSQTDFNNPTYNLTSVSDANGCTNTGNPLSSVTITTNSPPSGTLTVANSSLCEGSPIDLSFSSNTDTGPFTLVINGNSYPNILNGTNFSAGTAIYNPSPVSIWPSNSIGGSQNADNTATELGVKIKSSVDGSISGIRFYKTGFDILNFSVSLWAEGNTSTPLATANYTSDNTPGWKVINFSTPVNITANTNYIASYFSPNPNYYAYTADGLATPIVNAPLTAVASMYKQPGPGYPTSSSTANYWVDVVFSPRSSISNFLLTNITDHIGCTAGSSSNTSITVNQSATVNAGTANTICTGSPYTLTGASISGAASTGTWSITNVTGTMTNASSQLSNTNPTNNPAAVSFTPIAGHKGTVTLTLTTDDPQGPCSTQSASVVLTVNGYTWNGSISSAWTNSSNWSACGIPLSGSDVTIATTGSNPILPGSITLGSIDLQSNSILQIAANTLTINGGITGTGTLSGSSSSDLVIGGNAGTLLFSNGNNVLKNLTIQSGATATLGNALDITAGVDPGTLTVTGTGILNTGGFLTIKSDTNGTARVGNSTGTINGNATVERYIQAHRAWRFLTAPVSTTTAPSINAAWQENATTASAIPNPNPGYGTHITGGSIANGFDQNPFGRSSTKESIISDTWSDIGNTLQPVTSQDGYMVFVRGSRANDLNAGTGAVADPTTLRVSGKLKMGVQSFPATYPGQSFKVIGNPYASAIQLPTTWGGNPTTYSVWDPMMTGTNSVGAFVQYSWGGVEWSSTVTPISPIQGGIVESGSAFYLQYPAGTSTFTLTENAKTSGSHQVQNPTSPKEEMRINLNKINTDASISLQDGMLTIYDSVYSDLLDQWDAQKVTNFSQNISSIRNATKIAIERRAPIGYTDTTYIGLQQMTAGNYQLQLQASNLNHPNLLGKLVDNYSSSSFSLNLNSTSVYSFTVDVNPASAAVDRFNVVYYPATPLPVQFTSIKAWQQGTGNNIMVEWKVDNQVNIQQYLIEKSADGRQFSTIGTQAAIGGNGASMTYNFLDASSFVGDNFYRIRSIGLSGEPSYSSIVKVKIGKGISSISIYPNPVVDNYVNLQFNNLPKGDYLLKLFNNTGQIIFTSRISHQGGSATQSIAFNKAWAKGNYILEINKPNGSKEQLPIAIH